MESRECLSLFIPPTKWQVCSFRRGAEIKPKFIEQGPELRRFLERWEIVEDVLRFP
jgi:hypothetical protein